MNDNLKQFLADVTQFPAERGVWPQFLAYMQELGYSEADVEHFLADFGDQIGRRLV